MTSARATTVAGFIVLFPDETTVPVSVFGAGSGYAGIVGRSPAASSSTETSPGCVFTYSLTCKETSLCVSSGGYTFTHMYIEQRPNTSWDRYITLSDGKPETSVIVKRCGVTGGTTRVCTTYTQLWSEGFQVSQFGGIVATATRGIEGTQVPITGCYTSAGFENADSVWSDFSNCYLKQAAVLSTSAGTPTPTQHDPGATVSSGGMQASSKSSNLTTGTKAGIGVGVAVGAILLISFLLFMLVKRRRKPDQTPSPELDASTTSRPQELAYQPHMTQLPTGKEAHELPVQTRPTELPAR